MGFRARLNQGRSGLSPGVQSIFDVQPDFIGRPPGEDIAGRFTDPFGAAGQRLEREAARGPQLRGPGLSASSRLRAGELDTVVGSAVAKQTGRLAASGGLRSGARERLGEAGIQSGLQARSSLAQADEASRVQEDREARRLSQQNIANAAQQAQASAGLQLGAQQFDVGQAGQERRFQNVFQQRQADSLQRALAAEQQAQALAASGDTQGLFGGGGFLGLGGGLADPTQGIFGDSAGGKIANIAFQPVQFPFRAGEKLFSSIF